MAKLQLENFSNILPSAKNAALAIFALATTAVVGYLGYQHGAEVVAKVKEKCARRSEGSNQSDATLSTAQPTNIHHSHDHAHENDPDGNTLQGRTSPRQSI